MTSLLHPIVFLCVISLALASYEDAYRLERTIFTNYSTRLRPVQNYSKPISVIIGFTLLTIVDVNEIHNRLVVLGSLDITWIDEQLQWNPDDFGGIMYLNPYPKDIWRPRLQLTNSLEKLDTFEDKYSSVVLEHNGKVTWRPGVLFTSLCFLNLLKFPFDQHRCGLVFSPIFMNGSDIDIIVRKQNAEPDTYEENAEWHLSKASIFSSPGDIERQNTSIVLRIIIIFSRRPEFFTINFLVPVTLLSVLNLLTFVLVVEDGSVNISYSVTVLLAYTIYMSILIDFLPATSKNMPFVAVYLFLLFVVSLFTTIDIIFIVWLNNKEEENKKQEKSKLMRVMSKLISINKLKAKNIQKAVMSPMQIHPSDVPPKATYDTRVEEVDPITSVFAKETLSESSDTGQVIQNIDGRTVVQNDDDNAKHEPGNSSVNRYKCLSNNVRIYSFYVFASINLVIVCITCIMLFY